MVEKKKPEIKEIMKVSEIDGLNPDIAISNNILKNLKKKFGKISIPVVGIALDDTKQILFLITKPSEDPKDKKALVVHSNNVTEEVLREFIGILEKG